MVVVVSKKIVALVLVALLLIFIGCTSAPVTGSDTNNSDTNGGVDLNKGTTDKNSGIYNNLETLRKVKAGDTVSVHYVGKFPDGNIFDSSVGKSPLVFVAGEGNVIVGFDNAVIGMRVGEAKSVEIPPAQAYGEIDSAMIVTFDAGKFGDFNQITVGMEVASSQGAQGIVVAKDQNSATIDFNPPLAGKTLLFDITLVSIQ